MPFEPWKIIYVVLSFTRKKTYPIIKSKRLKFRGKIKIIDRQRPLPCALHLKHDLRCYDIMILQYYDTSIQMVGCVDQVKPGRHLLIFISLSRLGGMDILRYADGPRSHDSGVRQEAGGSRQETGPWCQTGYEKGKQLGLQEEAWVAHVCTLQIFV